MAIITGSQDHWLLPVEVFLCYAVVDREAIYRGRQPMERGDGVKDLTGRGRKRKRTASQVSGTVAQSSTEPGPK